MKKNIALIFFSLFIAIFFVEIYLRIFLPQDTSTPWRIYINDGLLLNKKEGESYHFYRRGNIKVKYSFGEFHNRKFDLNKSKNKILILGDSNPFGWFLDDEETYIYKIAEKFPKYEFINSSAGGHGTSDQLRYYEIFCNKIKPKITFVLINFEDIDRSKSSNLYFLDKNHDLKKGKNKIPKIYYFVDNNFFYDFLVSNLHIVGFLRKSYVILNNLKLFETNNKKQSNNDKIIKSSKKIKKENDKYLFEKKLYLKFKELSKKCNSDLFLINLAWFDKKKNFTKTYEFLDNNENFFIENNINYINLYSKMIEKYKNPEAYINIIKGDAAHPNVKGSELYFNILYNEFKKVIK